jgi:DNA-3-methyladenine glycosylase I
VSGQPTRCDWCGRDPLYVAYHDEEWGVPVYDDRRLFEMLTLEGAQAGLSWLAILRRREAYRRAFAGFDMESVAGFGDADVDRLLLDAGIVRNRLKIGSVIRNAMALLKVREAHGSLAAFLWQYGGGRPRQNAWRSLDEVPARTIESDRMSRDLKRLGCSFVGSTICHAFMQAVGMVNDHVVTCFRHREVRVLGEHLRARPHPASGPG